MATHEVHQLALAWRQRVGSAVGASPRAQCARPVAGHVDQAAAGARRPGGATEHGGVIVQPVPRGQAPGPGSCWAAGRGWRGRSQLQRHEQADAADFVEHGAAEVACMHMGRAWASCEAERGETPSGNAHPCRRAPAPSWAGLPLRPGGNTLARASAPPAPRQCLPHSHSPGAPQPAAACGSARPAQCPRRQPPRCAPPAFGTPWGSLVRSG
jgi:hypothetical protein